MIKIYKSMEHFQKSEVLLDNDAFFNNNISSRAFGEAERKVMQDIDQAVLLDDKTGKIETPYGITDIRDLSMGCKTILNYLFILKNPNLYRELKAVNVTECGANALEELFSIMEHVDGEIAVVLEHSNNLFACADREYVIDDNRVISTLYDF